MIKLINRFTNTEMWVADERVESYLGAGHTLAQSAQLTKVESEPEKKTKRATKKK